MTILNLEGNQWLEMLANASSTAKVLVFFLAWAVVWLPIAIPLARLINWHPVKPLTGKQKLPILASLYLIAPLIVWGAALVEGCSLADYGLYWDGGFWVSFVCGLGLSVGGIILMFTAEYLLGWLTWHGENIQRLRSIFLPLLGLGIWVGITEELVFRGFLNSQLEQDYANWLSAAISSMIFAILHLLWERKETIPQLPGLWLMGMVLSGAKLLAGGSLGLAIALHGGWVWVLSSLGSAELISYTGKVSPWITGWGKQPLAGAAGIFCLLVTGALLWLYYLN